MYRLANCATANGREVNQTAQEALMTVDSSVRVMHQGASVVPPQAWSDFYAKEDRLKRLIQRAIRERSREKAGQALSQAHQLLTDARRQTDAPNYETSFGPKASSPWPHAPSIVPANTVYPAAQPSPTYLAAPLPVSPVPSYVQSQGQGPVIWSPSHPTLPVSGLHNLTPGQCSRHFLSAPDPAFQYAAQYPGSPVVYVQSSPTYNIIVGSPSPYAACGF